MKVALAGVLLVLWTAVVVLARRLAKFRKYHPGPGLPPETSTSVRELLSSETYVSAGIPYLKALWLLMSALVVVFFVTFAAFFG